MNAPTTVWPHYQYTHKTGQTLHISGPISNSFTVDLKNNNWSMLAFKENQLNPSPFPRTYCKTTNAFSCLWSMTRMKAVNEIHSLMNDIYDIPDLGYSQWNVRQRLKAACLLLLNFWLQISTLIYTQLQPPWTILLEVFFLGYRYLLLSVFPLLLRASTGNFSQSFFEWFSGEVHAPNHTHL